MFPASGSVSPRSPGTLAGLDSAKAVTPLISLLDDPLNPTRPAVADKANDQVYMMAIESFDRVMQANLGINKLGRRQRIINPWRPAFFFERREHQFLIERWPAELLDQILAPP